MPKKIEDKFINSVPLAPLTTMRVGGTAKLYFEPSGVEDIRLALEWSRNNGDVAPFVFGLGSNVLIADTGYNGLVVRLNEKFAGIKWDDNKATVKAGTPLEELVLQACQRGMAGIEKLAGIPGSVGGAIYMNAGAYECCVSDCLMCVESVSDTDLIKRSPEEMNFGYRKSVFTDSGEIIVQAEFEFLSDSPERLLKIRDKIIKERHLKQPWDQPSAGSVFRRPPGYYTGALIEKAGLKGKCIGGAMISEKHAGFIVNTGSATAMDVYNLIQFAVEEVEKSSGVRLKTEIVIVGDFNL